MMRQLRNSLRNELVGAHGTATISHLAEVGVEFTQSGTIKLNEHVFDEAIQTHGDEVRSLFAGADGAFPAVSAVLDSYSTNAGLISNVKDRLNKQIAAMDDQIASLQARLALQRASLQREFTEADAAMSRLNSQSGSLANLGAGLGSL
jgi:flagellar capping protein FliD